MLSLINVLTFLLFVSLNRVIATTGGCNADNCLRALSQAPSSNSAFCSSYTVTNGFGPTPTEVAFQCESSSSRISSACSCFVTSTTSLSSTITTTSSSTTLTTSTTSTSTTPTSTTSTSTSTTSTSTTSTAPTSTPTTCSGTAYGYVPGQSTTFISLGIAENWGWVINGNPPITGTLYMGAGGNDLSKATIVGSFSIQHIGSSLVVTYSTNPPYSLSSTHFFYGSTYPSKIAPGQFGNTHDPLPQGATTDQFVLPFNAAKTTYIVHAGISC